MSSVAAFRSAGLRAHHLTMNLALPNGTTSANALQAIMRISGMFGAWLSWDCLIGVETLAHIQFKSKKPAPIVVWLWL